MKSLRSRNSYVIAAGAVYCAMERDLAIKNERPSRIDSPELSEVLEQLREYCKGKGRGNDPL